VRSGWLALALAGTVSLVIRAQAPAPQPRVRITESSAELEERNQAVTEDDLLILERAGRLLASPAVWNRHDTRECAPADTTWSLFCALEEASLLPSTGFEDVKRVLATATARVRARLEQQNTSRR